MPHNEFPELTEEAKEILTAAYRAAFPWHNGYKIEWTEANRIGAAALLRAAVEKAQEEGFWIHSIPYRRMEAIASNLHSPSPPLPTLAEARAADLNTLEGRNAVRSFLTLLALLEEKS